MQETFRRTEQNSVRQPLDQAPRRTHKFQLQSGNLFWAIYGGLFIMTSIGLFAYVNTYMIEELSQMVDRTVFSESTATFNCNGYFCNQVSYNLLYYNTFYQSCNPTNCQNTICSGYNCVDALNNPDYYPSTNAFYACYPLCVTNMSDSPVPESVTANYAVAITAACLFGFIVFISLVYGITMAICYKELEATERIALAVTAFMPGLKYTWIRERKDWDGFVLNTRLLVIFDTINTIFYGIIWGLYIYLASNGLFLSAVEITNFFFLLSAYLMYISVLSRNFRTMWNLQDSIRIFNMAY